MPSRANPVSAAGVSTESGSPPQTIRQKSAAMNDRPSVTSTCASCSPGRRRSRSRSASAPSRATASVASTAASQKLSLTPKTPITKLAPMYAPSMNSDPCVKFGIRISPKIREKPADRRKSSPPKVMLFTVSTSQNVIAADIPRSNRQIIRRRLMRRLRGSSSSRFERRVVARIDGLLEELLLVVGPELAHVMVRLDRLIDQLAVRLFEMANVEIADHVAEMVELDRATRRVGERY